MALKPEFGPFKVNFDKPTYNVLKEMSDTAGVYKTDMVIMAVRMIYTLARNRELLTESGHAKWKEIVDSFKKPAGLDI